MNDERSAQGAQNRLERSQGEEPHLHASARRRRPLPKRESWMFRQGLTRSQLDNWLRNGDAYDPW